ncbi:Penicillin-binding protein A [uncultured Clostridium sp.]|nr:Penicillin-binding protein A [uncultured Clostridium sp.]
MKQMIRYLVKKRICLFCIVLLAMFLILLRRFFSLQILNGAYYRQAFQSQVEREEIYHGSRGNIYDRNGNQLAYNDLAYSVTIEDSGAYENRRTRNETLNRTIRQSILLIEGNGDSVLQRLPIAVSGSQEYEFTVEGNRLLRFLADVYGHARVEDLAYNGRLGYEEGEATAEQVIAYLCSDPMYGISDELSGEDLLKLVSIRYDMADNQYQRYRKTNLAENVSLKTMTAVLENQAELPGVDISEQTIRRYTDSLYFAHILGYTGPVSEEELASFQSRGILYDRNDIVGKAGMEQAMEEELHGRNGGQRFYVDNVGRVTEVLETEAASTGRNVYLTIDRDLQKAVYCLLEQKLAGILLANIVPSQEDSSNLNIPVQDVYYALISNHVIDIERLGRDDAGMEERNLFRMFEEHKSEYLDRLGGGMELPYGSLEEDMQEGMDYILELLARMEIYKRDEADRAGETYRQWQEQEISLKEFLQNGIAQGFINAHGFPEEGSYSMLEENLRQLEAMILTGLQEDEDFDRLLYRLLIHRGVITGEQICRILLEQGVVADTGNDHENLGNGTDNAYRFIREKIQNLEITPAQLALDPSTASSVVVDPNTGEVLASVTYPGYDNNRLANTMDGDYYNQLLNDASLPLYNNATQQRTAPGSTFKPITVAAGLTEQIITPDRLIEDQGIFELVTPSPRCWIYPSGATHGAINVVEAIRDSCNYFFYTLGYELSLDNGIYQESKGTEIIARYGEMFGLNENSGIEISESAPQIADEFPVTASIGQSNHNYTTTQLARYAAALANKGTLYQLTLIQRIQEGAEGAIRPAAPKENRTLDEIVPSAWDTIAEGMELVAGNNRILRELPMAVAGKTGTAQQNRTRPNHALFIGYAPYEQPEIAVATRIAYGYSSSNAVEVTSDIFKYYFGLEDEEQLLTGRAEVPENSGNSFTD